VVLVIGGAYALASGNWCGSWSERPPVLSASALAQGALRVGAAAVDLAPPYPVVMAGYGPPRAEAHGAAKPLQARALVLEVEQVRVGLVELDALTAPESLVQEVRRGGQDLRLGALWVVASHTHSGFGGYDARLVSELAGTGRYSQAARDALVGGALDALRRAAADLRPASLEVGEQASPGLVRSRDEGQAAEGRLSRIVFRAGDSVPAQLLLFAAHPTLVPRGGRALDPDYPGRVSVDGGVMLVLQSEVGNASAVGTSPREYADALGKAFAAIPTAAVEPVKLGYARVEAALPRPDASRLVPSFTRAAGDNFLCGSALHVAEVDAMQLGPLLFVTVPGEPTSDAAREIQSASGATRVLALANGYLGYVDTAQRVQTAQGESKRQYFGPTLSMALARAAEAATQPLRAAPAAPSP
jgi:neutral ceramidase